VRDVGVEYCRLEPGQILPAAVGRSPFKAIIVFESDAALEWRNGVSDWLVASGSRYVMAWGADCAEWHDAVDDAQIRKFPDAGVEDDEFVMTTWHEDEPLKEVFWFARTCARHPVAATAFTLILHISMGDKRDEMLDLFAAAGAADYLPD
jgi:hypothetical protein